MNPVLKPPNPKALNKTLKNAKRLKPLALPKALHWKQLQTGSPW